MSFSSLLSSCKLNIKTLLSNRLSKLALLGPFKGATDRFNGITIDSTNENMNTEVFTKTLNDSLHKWETEKRRCIWFKVNIKHSAWVPILAEKGFNFHHARDDFVMMYKWLPKDSEPNLPPSSHTNLGVGAMVFNKKDQMLVVSEKHYQYPHWKLPGGYVERGEDITDAAVREVKEETGVDATFLSLITFRHTHNMMYNNSDIYILLMMKALSETLNPSQREVNECKWMDISEYANHQHVHEFNKFVARKALEYRDKNIKLDMQKKTVKWPQYSREMNILIIDEVKY